MWTPKRVILLVAGIAVFLTGFEVYAYFLGGIDGLPPLPAFYQPIPGVIAVQPVGPPRESETDHKLRQGFGPDCEEVHRPIKLDVRSKHMVLATNDVKIDEEHDGRVKLIGFSLAVFGSNAGDAAFPEINTIKSDIAYLTFDQPVTSPMEMTNRKIVACELRNNIKLVNNRRTPEKSDDIEVRILTDDTPLFYEDKQNKIWTKGLVQLLDTQTKPQPTMIWASGLDLYLSRDNGKPVPKKGPATARAKTDTVSGVDVVELHSNVVMYLWDSGAGLLGGDKAQKTDTAKNKKDAAPAGRAAEGQRIQVKITTNGPFRYFVARDLACFESPTVSSRDPGDVLLEDRVVVQRVHQVVQPVDVAALAGNLLLQRQLHPLGAFARICYATTLVDRILLDTITCDRLELQFRRKAGADSGPARGEQSSQKEIETAYASARPGQEVVLISQKETLEAHGKELIFFAATTERGPQTVIKGDPNQPMIALKDNNKIKAVELNMIGADRKGEGQRAYAKGPGRIDLWDKKTQSYPHHAVWSDGLTTTKEADGNRVYDQLTLLGDAAFVDDEHDQEMRAQRLQLWLEPADRAAADREGAPKEQPTAASGQRPHKLEAFDHVQTRSPDLMIHGCDHLMVRWKDVPPAPTAAPFVPASTAPAPAATTKESAPAKEPEPAAKQDTQAPSKSKKVIELWGRSVAAYVLRSGARNDLQEVVTEGAVHVHQEGATPGEKGVDIKGETLNLIHHPEGDTLIVFGDSRRPNDSPAQLQFGELFLAGPKVTINQKDNTAEVIGCGLMNMPGGATFDGGKTTKPGSRLTVEWNQYMLFESKVANFHGGVVVHQDQGFLRCDALEVTLDRPVSFKEGQKGGQQAKVEKMLASLNVYVKDSVYDKDQPTKLTRYQRLVARSLEVENPDGPARASGPGKTYLLQYGTADTSLAAGPTSATKPASPKAPAAEPKKMLTIVEFTGSMFSKAYGKDRYTVFRENVDLHHFPAESPDVKPDPDHPPKDGMYLHCGTLNIWSKALADGKTNQIMKAETSVSFRTPEFYGTADVVTYDEQLDRMVFEGLNGSYARLYQLNPQGAGVAKTIPGKKILYERKTGRINADGVPMILISDPGR
jgi:lipopolysaccharide export system protein LptA